MSWSALFLVCIAQGLFLISAIAYRGSKNPLASRLIIALLVLMIIPNFGYLVIRTDLKYYAPQVFGVPFGMGLLYGPLFFLYSRSVMDGSFRWKKQYWLHFMPYFVHALFNIPFLWMDKKYLIEFIDTFLSGDLPAPSFAKLLFAIQNLHLFVYLLFTFRWLQSVKGNSGNAGNAQYLIPLSTRLKWVEELFYCFTLFFVTVFALYIFVLINGKYNPLTNYIYTFITSGIIYFIAYKLVLNPEPISPDFTPKYRAYMPFVGRDGERYLQKLKSLMGHTKVFLDPDLDLALLAEQIGLPSYQVSKLINEKFGKSFNDFINEHRVREFLSLVNDPQYRSFTIYGLALVVGFNSKSSFNTAFKKITGKTPSEYKTLS
jgi:AraC-like DNA-binding protein